MSEAQLGLEKVTKYLGHMQTQLKGRLMGGQVRGRRPRRQAGQQKASVWICEALCESFLAGLPECRSLPETRSPSGKKPPLSLLVAEFREIQVGSECWRVCKERTMAESMGWITDPAAVGG